MEVAMSKIYSIVCLKGRDGMGRYFRWRSLGSLWRVTLEQRSKQVLVHWVSPSVLGGSSGCWWRINKTPALLHPVLMGTRKSSAASKKSGLETCSFQVMTLPPTSIFQRRVSHEEANKCAAG